MSFFLLISLTAIGSNYISGIIIDEQKQPIEFANILLQNTNNTSLINGTTTDSTGRFVISKIENGNYFLEVLYVGYKTDTLKSIEITTDTNIDIGIISLQLMDNMLSNIDISGLKPIIERKADRIVYNVENSAKASGENVMDLLRSVPGVTVSGNDQIRINGKSDVQVMINGKVEQLNAEQLATLLKSIQSSNVKKIDVVSNPSAKYDAETKGGVLEIHLKSSMKSGMNGSVFINYRQNEYASTDMGFNMNVRHKKITLSLNYNFGYNNNYQRNIFQRDFTTDSTIIRYDEKSFDKNKFINHYGNLVFKYSINEKHSFGISSEIFQFKNPHNATSTLNIYDNILLAEQINSIQSTKNISNGKGINPSLNFNYKGKLDSLGSAIELIYDYTYSNLYTNSHLNLAYLDSLSNEKPIPHFDFIQDNPYIVHLHTTQLNYSKHLKKEHVIEVGLKFTWTKTTNDIQYKNLIGNTYILDSTKSNKFQYIENINAIYGTWSKSWKKGWSTNLGLRIEQTNTNQRSYTLQTLVKRHYVDFFPSLFIQKNIKENHSININFSRKIKRPDYNDLNPFQFYLSPYSIWTGNENLKSQYANITEFTYTLKNAYSFFISHENLNNNYTHLVFQDDSTKISTYRASNFKVRNNLNLGVNINKELFNWWMISYSAQYIFFNYNSIVNDLPFKNTSHKFHISLDNTFILPKDFTINIFAFYTSPHLDATDVMKSDGMVNISVSKTFFDKKLRIRLAGNDIFGTKNFSYDTDFFNVKSISRNKWSSRFFALSVSYNFQKGKKFQNTRMQKSNEEEKNRIGGNS
ncbi:MAG: outer membrane beta-barrel family protein [Chitinophagales bacterium]|nr:TonB-dependent receptor [Bacteroidota bacterium]